MCLTSFGPCLQEKTVKEIDVIQRKNTQQLFDLKVIHAQIHMNESTIGKHINTLALACAVIVFIHVCGRIRGNVRYVSYLLTRVHIVTRMHPQGMLNKSEQARRDLEIQLSNSKAREEEFHLAFRSGEKFESESTRFLGRNMSFLMHASASDADT
jgi:hypothetical protein